MFVKALTLLSNLLFSASLPPVCVDDLTASILVPLAKSSNGVRPIAIGEAFIRIAGKVAMAKVRGLGAEGERQYGVCKQAGLERLLHKLREGMDTKLIASVLFLDFKNAFNSVSRAHIAREVAKVLPRLSRFFHLAYSRPAKLFLRRRGAPPAVLLSRAGVRQGDPLGSLYFAIAIAPLLRALAARFPALDVDAYCDDVTVTAPDEALPKDEVIAFAEAEGAPFGLVLQPPKCTLWRASSGEAVVLLGAPLGQAAPVRAARRAKVEREHAKLEALKKAPHQVALLLLRFCHAPRLNHLARTLPPAVARPAFEAWDEAVLNALAPLAGLPDLTPLQAGLAHQPLAQGGLGLPHLAGVAEAAFSSSLAFAAASFAEANSPLALSPPSQDLVDHHYSRVGTA